MSREQLPYLLLAVASIAGIGYVLFIHGRWRSAAWVVTDLIRMRDDAVRGLAQIGEAVIGLNREESSMVPMGAKVRDTITRFTGIATGRAVFLNGCVRVLIEGKEKNGDPKEYWADEQRVEVVRRDAFKAQPSPALAGGPAPVPPSRDPR